MPIPPQMTREQLMMRGGEIGYVRGLNMAVKFLRTSDLDRPNLDRATVRSLADAVAAMATSAAQRLNVDPNGEAA